MQIGGTLVNAVVRIAVLAATLALVYFFILRPILDTTETVSGGISGNLEKTFDEINQAFDEAGGQKRGITQVQIRRQINQADGKSRQKLINCIEQARQDIERIQRCANRFGY